MGIKMGYIVNFDSENSSLMVTKESEGDWFTPTTKCMMWKNMMEF